MFSVSVNLPKFLEFQVMLVMLITPMMTMLMMVVVIMIMTTMSMMMLFVNLPKFLEFQVIIVGYEDHHDLYDDVPNGANHIEEHRTFNVQYSIFNRV